MSTISKFLLTFTFLWGIAISSAHAQLQIIQSGAQCKAANLAQALNLGMGNSQLGVKNNGSAAFFIVCPVIMTGPVIESGGMIGRVPTAGETIACTARFKIFNSASDTYISSSLVLETDPKNASPKIVNGGVDITTPSGTFIHNGTVVCVLGPGQSIESYGFSSESDAPPQ